MRYLDCFVVGDVVVNTLSEMLCGDAVDSFNSSIDNQTSTFESHNNSFENHKQLQRRTVELRSLTSTQILS